MAASEAEIQAQLQASVNWFQKLYLQASINSGNQVSLEDTFAQAIEGQYTPDSLAAMRRLSRAPLSTALSKTAVREVLWPVLKEYGTVIYNIPSSYGELPFLRELHKQWCDAGTAITFKRRNPSFGTITADGSNTGTGTVNRLTVDWRNHVLQNMHAEAKRITCKRDKASGGTKHEEVFEIRGVNAPIDNLSLGGSGIVSSITGISARTSERFLSNPSFSSFTGTAGSAFSATTDLTDWTLSSAANFVPITSDYYRDFEGDTTPTCVRFLTDGTITQAFSVRRATFDYYTPYYVQVAFKRESSCDGNFTIDFGASTATVALSAQSGWTILRIAIGQGNWLRQFSEADLNLVLTLASNTTGELLVDDVIVAPYQLHDGIWYAPVGGATAWETDDFFTWTDSIATDSVIARWIAFGFDFSVPTASSPQVADPS